ncbi:MCE-family protein MCE1A [Mycolicibacterium moriokaense]|jgi:phospholipid/cholesterol/gamma-HCH transport system substrate-binding protein|nr:MULTISPECIES: MCE family protein [unclassified Mycolicibacterium]MCV7038721.1 MCE family protein [Mycolicibacterium moriokaense]ORB25332.1 MCE-family protein MCE1A [Mycolicibacterium moriokaense]
MKTPVRVSRSSNRAAVSRTLNHWRHHPPLRTAGTVTLALVVVVVSTVYLQFRGEFSPAMHLTLVSDRAGLVMEPGAKVTYNGVEIGRVAAVRAIQQGDTTKAKLSLDVAPKYIELIPANVTAEIKASTVFGNKYVAFRSPSRPASARVSSSQVIDVSHVTTEFNTLFETLMSIAQKVDPVKLNLTLAATAEALDGHGLDFGRSIVAGNAVLDDINPQMPQIREDTRRLTDLADVYAKSSPDFWNFLNNAATTAGTVNEQRADLDAALLAAAGFGDTGADVVGRGSPYLVRGLADLVTTTDTLNTYSPEFLCSIRNYAAILPQTVESAGGNGYSIDFRIGLTGAPNPYVYPDNLPRSNARGGPGGAPGCWQTVTKDFWPAPYLVADTGASLAPYNHLELGQPLLTEYVWGRQVGENTINP